VSIRDRDYRSGTLVPGSGTTKIPMYSCSTCRDSGVQHLRETALDADSGLSTREYVTRPCSRCDGRPRFAGELLYDDAVVVA
jgi:hypothetical protein